MMQPRKHGVFAAQMTPLQEVYELIKSAPKGMRCRVASNLFEELQNSHELVWNQDGSRFLLIEGIEVHEHPEYPSNASFMEWCSQ
jgi:hypothetical protein